MKIKLDWYPPLALKPGNPPYIYACDLDIIPKSCGVYIFARQFGDSLEYLYIGETNNIHSRVKGHLNSLSLMGHIKGSRKGRRLLLYATLKHNQNINAKAALGIVERALIDFALLQQHAIHNKQGTRRPYHIIESTFPPGHKRRMGFPKITNTLARR